MTVHLSLCLNADLLLDPSIPCCSKTAIWDQAGMPGLSCTECWPRNLQPLRRLLKGSFPCAACLVLGSAVCSFSSQLLQPASSHLFPFPVTLQHQCLFAVARVLLIRTWSLPWQMTREVWLTNKCFALLCVISTWFLSTFSLRKPTAA